MDTWRSFQKGYWCENIDVRDFIQKNYTAYTGDESFLQGATNRTKSVLQKYNDLVKKEMDNGGVLDIDTDHVASLLSFEPGYLSKYEDIILGLQTDEPLKRAVNPFAGKRMSVQACKSYGYEMSSDLRSAFKYKTTHNDGVFHAYTDEMKKARHCGIITGLPDAYARGRIIGDYRRIALYGMDFLIAKKKKDKFDLGKKEMTDENIRLLEEISKQLDFMDKLIIMADQYGCDIKRPASSFKEAVQWLYFGYLGGVKEQNGAANSIGRITTFLDIYAERDIKENKLDEFHAQEIIDDLVLKLRLVRHLRTPEYNELFAGDPTWVTTSEGGMSENGKTLVTKTSFRMLNTLYNLGSSAEPNITILWANDLPKGFKEYCSKVSIDTDSIQYENDDEMRKYHGDDYAIACCVSALTVGKQMQFFGARCNLAKVLLMALNGGKDEIYGEQIAPEGDIFSDDILDFDKVLQAYKKYMSWMANLYVKTMNIIHYMHDKYAYERLMMSLHDTNVERLMAFGISGFSVLADSLSAIKHAKVKPIKDCRGIITNFEIDGDFPTYGNDDDRVDSIAEWICESFYQELCKTKAYRNAKHTLSLLTITSNVMYGKKTGNTPDGREKGAPFAPGANPMHGRDKNGALASLNSVAKLDYKFCQDGISNTFTIVPNALGKTEKEKIEKLTTILNGYFIQGSHHINVNVLDREKLLDAMDNPEKYPNLTIRVSGYAVNFNKLSQEQKREVIARTFHGSL